MPHPQEHGHRPPPPPQRRNSTITAATPTAPSIADLRGNASAAAAGFYQAIPQQNGCGRPPATTRTTQLNQPQRHPQSQPPQQQTSRYYPRV